MMRYILKRMLMMLPTLFGITLITFFVMKLAPGDPKMLKLMFAQNNLSAQDVVAYLKDEKPVIVVPDFYVHFSNSVAHVFPAAKNILIKAGEQTTLYFKWLSGVVRFDFGLSERDYRPVTKVILEALPYTLILNLASILFVYIVSVPLGMLAAFKRGQRFDRMSLFLLLVLYSIPAFWLATMLMTYLSGGEYLDLFPLTGLVSDHFESFNFVQKCVDLIWHITLPVLSLSCAGIAFMARFSRGNFLDVMSRDFVRTGVSKGLTKPVLWRRYILRNALIPFVTLFGGMLPGLIGGSVLIEQIFGIPGMGMLSFEAVLSRDHNLIMGLATIGALLTLLGTLVSDILYRVVDPRITL